MTIYKKGIAMAKQTIRDPESLLAAISTIHDSGFKVDDVEYNPTEKTVTINTTEYEYKGKFVQIQTKKIAAKHKLILSNIENYEIIPKDKKGYQVVFEDYIDCANIEAERLIIICTFHDIQLIFSNLYGELMSFPPNVC
jgi:hypothetical protein